MFTPAELARVATLKRNTTILQQTAPASAGGLSAAVISGKVQLTTWIPEQEITIALTVQEVFALRCFLNMVVDAVINGTDYPDAMIGRRQ
ncbi:hypothetical protein [Propionivibrio sp.]|uniref:hypothetical protein n=1 Tax=Propionivibrio sp. TaxID=2212460 RepID=UPI003BF26BE5